MRVRIFLLKALRSSFFIYPFVVIASVVVWGWESNKFAMWSYLSMGLLALILAKWIDFALGGRISRRPIIVGNISNEVLDLSSLITVIIPAYNEEKVIASCIESLLSNGLTPQQIVIVDDGSTDGTASLVKNKFPNVVLVRQSNQGKAAALNNGLSKVETPLVAFMDADSISTKQLLRNACLFMQQQPTISGVSSLVLVGNKRGILSYLQCIEYISALNLPKVGLSQYASVPVITGVFGVYRTQVLRSIGGVPVDTLVEDADLSLKMLANGYRTSFSEELICLTEAPQNVFDLGRQRRRWAVGFQQVASKYQQAMFFRDSKFFAALVFFITHYLLRSCFFGSYLLSSIFISILLATPVPLLVLWLISTILLSISFMLGYEVLGAGKKFIPQSFAALILILPLYFFYSLALDIINFFGGVRLMLFEYNRWDKLQRMGIFSEGSQ